MIKPTLCAVAESVSVDGETNVTSILGLLEQIQAESFPVLMQRMTFIVFYVRDAGDPTELRGEFTVTIGNQTIVMQAVNVKFLDTLRTRVVVKLVGMTIPQPGKLKFRLALPGVDDAESETEITAMAPKIQQMPTH